MKRASLYESSTNVGVITINELQKAFPALATAYRQIFSGKRPDIKVVSTDHFSGSGGGQGTREIAVFYKNGQTKMIQGSWGGANANASATANALDLSSAIPLGFDEGVMACTEGYYQSCRLYLNPSLVNPTLLGSPDQATDLDMFEVAVIAAMGSLISSFRKKEFFEFMQGSLGSFRLEEPFKVKPTKEQKKQLFKDKYAPMGVTTYDQLWMKILQNLSQKDYLKISSNGATALTMKGKNRYTTLGRGSI